MRRAVSTIAVTAGCVGVIALVLAFRDGPQAHGSVSTVAEVRQLLADRYYRSVPAWVLRQRSLSSLLSALGDPYTEYLTPAQLAALRRRQAGQYSGIGVTVTPQDTGLLVTSAPPGPARRAGMRPGDTIVTIDGIPTAELTLEQAVAKVTGANGTRVALGVLRSGRPLAFRIVRTDLRTPPARGYTIVHNGRRVGVLRVYRFADGTAAAVRRAIAAARRAGADGFVLDLRNNPGGDLDQAVRVASLFLDQGVVVRVGGRHEPWRTFHASGRPVAADDPLVVLVNRFSASAAEIVAAALRENDRSLVVGEQTFGKALVQEIDLLPGGGALKVTVARYVTPGGHDISARGIVPDVFAIDNPETLASEPLPAAIALLRSR